MTNRERFMAFAGFEPVDRIPRTAGYTEHLYEQLKRRYGADPYQHFAMDNGHGCGLTARTVPEGFTWPDYSVYHPGRKAGVDGFSIDGNGVGHINHGFYHFTEYVSPLRDARSIEELERYPIVSNVGWSDEDMRKARADAHAAGNFAAVFVGHMYENAWQVRGYEEFLMDLLTRREWAELLLDRFYENNLRTAAAVGKAGYDLLMCGDDVASQTAMMFQPALWREVMKPRWANVIAAARAAKPDIHVWYHTDGNVTEIVDDLIEIGITILNPVQPECMDPVALRRRYGKRLAFDGCVGTQTTFPFGTAADMRRVVRELVTALDGRNGGLKLAPTHVLEPEVPAENIEAFFESCDQA
jgi:uroporphyrinogen decarboxylase